MAIELREYGYLQCRMGVPMAMGRPKAQLVLRPEQREQLEGLASSRSLPAELVSRARIILLGASGKTNMQIARQLGLTNATVGKWRRRFLEQDVSGLHDELRPGRPRPISDERVAQLVRKTLETKPKDGTHWSIRPLERTQPMLPMGLGYVEGVTHDYRRHGTTTLFAALDTAQGTVITRCRRRHRHQEYLDFLRQIDKSVPPQLHVHIIVDNYAT